MKRYLVFEFDQYYPGGGFTDFLADFDTLPEVEAVPMRRENRHVIDCLSRECVVSIGHDGIAAGPVIGTYRAADIIVDALNEMYPDSVECEFRGSGCSAKEQCRCPMSRAAKIELQLALAALNPKGES